MTKRELEDLKNLKQEIHIDEITDTSDRTLMMGINENGNPFHVYIRYKSIHKYIYEDKTGESIYYKSNKSFNVYQLIPCSSTYYEYSDYEFCKLLMRFGVDMFFDEYRECKIKVIKNERYFGRIFEE